MKTQTNRLNMRRIQKEETIWKGNASSEEQAARNSTLVPLFILAYVKGGDEDVARTARAQGGYLR
jgi:hypothetical protein